jgi:hypothetical protein
MGERWFSKVSLVADVRSQLRKGRKEYDDGDDDDEIEYY